MNRIFRFVELLLVVTVVACSSANDEKLCWVCKRTETDLIAQRDALIKTLTIDIANCEKQQETIVNDITKDFNANKPSVTSIRPEYLKMTYAAFVENKQSLLQLDKRLQILYDYCENYYNGKNISFTTIQDIADAYQDEPLEERYSKLVAEVEKEKQTLEAQKARLENMHTFFTQKTITAADIDKAYQKPKNFEGTHDLPTFSSLGMELEKTIWVCPYCAALLAESSSGKFNLYRDLYASQDYIEADTEESEN